MARVERMAWIAYRDSRNAIVWSNWKRLSNLKLNVENNEVFEPKHIKGITWKQHSRW